MRRNLTPPTARSRRWPGVLVAALVVFLTWLLTGPVAWASPPPLTEPPVDLGSITLVDPDDPSTVLAGGASATVFELRLPDGAACPGDSLHDQWRVQSFIIPADADPAKVVYGPNGPEGVQQFALYEVSTSPFTDILTRSNNAAGQPGVIAGIPSLSFAVFPPATLLDGRYRMGVACTFFRQTAQYWDAEVLVTTTADDSPGGMTWRLADPPAGASLPTTTEKSTNWLTPTLAGAAVVAAGAALWWGRQSRQHTRSKESE